MKHHAYHKQELAALYFPGDSKRNAGYKFRTLLQTTPGLLDRLYNEAFYTKKQRIITPRQLKIIVEALGEP